MNTSIYIETSIPSFNYDSRPEPDRVARRQWTRRWWDDHASDYDAYTSEAMKPDPPIDDIREIRHQISTLLAHPDKR